MRSLIPLALVLLLVATLFPVVAEAQHQGGGRDPYSQDPGDGCLGPDDPFCDSGDGDGSDPSRCQSCEPGDWVQDSDGNVRRQYDCVSTGADFSTTTFAQCTGGLDRCWTRNPCSIA